jgi:hypothetical protein
MTPEDSLQVILDRLEEQGVSYMITGSFASNVHGIPRATQDADVIMEADRVRLREFLRSLGDDFYADPDTAEIAFSTNRMFNIIHKPTGFKVDIILRKERAFSEEEFSRRKKVEFLGRPRWFATAEDVILAKLEWARMGSSERQFEDAVNIGRVQGDSLDRGYLLKWAKSLELEHLLHRLLSRLEEGHGSA